MNNGLLFEYALKNGYVLAVLLICSIIAVKVIIEKYLQFKALDEKLHNDLFKEVINLISEGKFSEAIELSSKEIVQGKSKFTQPLAGVYKFLIDNRTTETESLIDRGMIQVDKQIAFFEIKLGILATFGNITPFIGLFGTVLGIIRAFNALSINDTTGYSSLMGGIAEALISTAAGLLVAIPSVMFYNYFSRKLKTTLPLFEEAVNETVYALKAEKENK